MPLRLSAKATGIDAAKLALKHLPKAMRNRAMRSGFRRIGQALAKAVKSQIPGRSKQRTGQSKKSIGFKVKLYRTSGNISVIIGPRSGHSVGIVTRNGTRVHNPTRVFHFQDGGRRGSQGRKYLRRALQRMKTTFPGIMSQEVRKAIAKHDARQQTG